MKRSLANKQAAGLGEMLLDIQRSCVKKVRVNIDRDQKLRL
jgi:hypothetical protein